MNPQPPDHDSTLLLAAVLRDAAGRRYAPGAVRVAGGRIVGAGPADELRRAAERDGSAIGREIDLGRRLLIPTLVNAHTHLDLTDAPSAPRGGDFAHWLEHVVASRTPDESAVATAVRRGYELCRAAGVGVVGDVAGSPAAVQSLIDAAGAHAPPVEAVAVSHLECFGAGVGGERRLLDRAAELDGIAFPPAVRPGLSPHAPYSVSPPAYEAAARFAAARGLAVQTHLAETPEEIDFVRTAAGPLADMLRRIGRWDPSNRPTGRHPLDHAAPALGHQPLALVHCNYLDDADTQRIARCAAAVVYCPRAAAFFGHRDHPYRRLLDAGVPVALGTDSILCHDARDASAVSILEEMRTLHRRDVVPPERLLAMATTHGRAALGLDPRHGELAPDAPARFTAVAIDPAHPDPLRSALEGDAPAELVALDAV